MPIIAAINNKLVQVININVEKQPAAGQGVLSLFIGEKHCSFAVTGFPGNKLSRLEYFTADCIDEIFLSNLFLSQGWQSNTFLQTQVCFDYSKSLLVPLQYHNPGTAEFLLQTMTGDIAGTKIISESIDEWQIINLFAVPNGIYNCIRLRFPSVVYRHSYTTSIRLKCIKEVEDCLLLDFRASAFSVIAVKEKKILLARQFTYNTPEDVIFHLLTVCRQFSLSPPEIKLFIAGLIEKESFLFKEIFRFFLHIIFRDASDWGNIIPDENNYPAHYFTSLNDLARCAS